MFHTYIVKIKWKCPDIRPPPNTPWVKYDYKEFEVYSLKYLREDNNKLENIQWIIKDSPSSAVYAMEVNQFYYRAIWWLSIPHALWQFFRQSVGGTDYW